MRQYSSAIARVEPSPDSAGAILDRLSNQSFAPIGQPSQIVSASKSPPQPQRSSLSGSGLMSSDAAKPHVISATLTMFTNSSVSSSMLSGLSSQSAQIPSRSVILTMRISAIYELSATMSRTMKAGWTVLFSAISSSLREGSA